MPVPPSRLLHLDALKALAAQAIVWHHLASYGPVADTLHEVLPEVAEPLFAYGRMAVQVFFVVGGFLAARALAPHGEALQGPLGSVAALLARRHLRLAAPFFAAVLLTLACSWVVAPWLPDLVPASVGATQLLSHALLLHGVMGQESLTVGAWYVAVDLQLFAMLAGLLWCAGRLTPSRWAAPAFVLGAVTASLWVFNLDARLDDWAPYFFGAYGLGVLVHWLGASHWRKRWLAALGALGVAALAWDFRGRIAVALATALALALLQWRHEAGRPLLDASRGTAVLAHLGTHSYALFLVHFPVCLLVNALFEHKDPTQQGAALMAFVGAWLLSNAAAVPFHRWVEVPAARLRFSGTPATGMMAPAHARQARPHPIRPDTP